MSELPKKWAELDEKEIIEKLKEEPSGLETFCFNEFDRKMLKIIYTYLAEDIGKTFSIEPEYTDLNEDPNMDCIQYWLVSFLYEKKIYKDIFTESLLGRDYAKKLENYFVKTYKEIGGGYRPTILLMQNDEDEDTDFYSSAESVEEMFCGLEDLVIKSVGVIASKLGIDNSVIFDHHQERSNEYDEKYIELLDHIKKNHE